MSPDRLLARIRREFQDHPGIVVTLPQAQSRWPSTKPTVRSIESLIAEGFLRRIGDVYLWPKRRHRTSGSPTDTRITDPRTRRRAPRARKALTAEANVWPRLPPSYRFGDRHSILVGTE